MYNFPWESRHIIVLMTFWNHWSLFRSFSSVSLIPTPYRTCIFWFFPQALVGFPIFAKKIISRNTKGAETDGCFVGIPPISRNKKYTKFHQASFPDGSLEERDGPNAVHCQIHLLVDSICPLKAGIDHTQITHGMKGRSSKVTNHSPSLSEWHI